jgi:hypothetical protein
LVSIEPALPVPAEEPVGALCGDDESLPLHPPAASASATSRAAAVVRDRLEAAWKGGKPRVLSGLLGGFVADVRGAVDTGRRWPVVVTGYTMHQRSTVLRYLRAWGTSLEN